MANILLVYPAPNEFKDRRFGFSLDLLYLSSLLKQSGHHIVNYLDYSIETFDLKKFFDCLEKTDVVILEFDSFPLKRAINIHHGEKLVRDIISRFESGSNRKKKIILFGNDVALGDYSLFKEGGFFRENRPPIPPTKAFDFEFDFALTANYSLNINIIVESLLTGDPLPELQPLNNLDQFPFPDRILLTPFAEHGGTIDQKPGLQKSTLIRTSTGCLNKCVFCQRKAWHKKYQTHSINYVLNEFSELKKHHYRNIWITDDNFTYDLERAKTLLKELANRDLTIDMKIALSSWTHIDEEFLEIAKKAHVSIISFGVETADPEIQRFYRKIISLTRLRELIHCADKIGIYTVGNFIIGAPMETETTIEKTFYYAVNTPFDQVNVKILDYMAGSELYEGLTPEKKNINRHIFACKDNGLNEFPLEELRAKIKAFLKKFRQTREGHLKEKINTFGSPYYLF